MLPFKRSEYPLHLEISGKCVCQLTDTHYLGIKSKEYKEDIVEIRIKFLVERIITSLFQNVKLL